MASLTVSRLLTPRSYVFVLAFCAISLVPAEAGSDDYYTSLVGLHKLARVEQQIVSALGEYVSNLEGRLELARRYLRDYEKSVLPVMSTILGGDDADKGKTTLTVYNDEVALEKLAEKVSSHPLMTYRLIRRYAKELVDFEKDLRQDHDKKFSRVMEKIRKGMVLPKPTDVAGAIEGLLRVQDAYDIDIDHFSKGKFTDLKTNSRLLAVDCYHVGMYSFKSSVFTRAIEWLEQAYLLTQHEGDTSIDPRVVHKALQDAITKHNQMLYSSKTNYYLYKAPVLSNLTDRGTRERVLNTKSHELYMRNNTMMDFTNFAALCGGKQLRPPSTTKNLKCYYESKFPTFVLDPYKVEQLHENPSVVQIYEVLPNSMIDGILQLAIPSMARSKVQGSGGTKDVASAVRTSTTAWLVERDFPIMSKIPLRVQQLTGLNIVSPGGAEDLQISSYGIGGHYNPHFDTLFDSVHITSLSPSERGLGDRMATFMFYLSDVEIGGGTAFPRLGVLARPIKGSALFWHNMERNGQPDPLSLHGGCPVLYGNKWVANKWIRSNSQMFHRPCSTDFSL